jgi:mono/diheme cytochrome c family protein
MRPLLIALWALLVASTAVADSYEEHDYTLNCSGCHRMDGAGSSVVPSLTGMRELAGRPGAREYWLRVPGAAQAPLTDARLAALMNWLMKRFTGKAPMPPYTAAEVARLRRTPLRDPLAERERILAAPRR